MMRFIVLLLALAVIWTSLPEEYKAVVATFVESEPVQQAAEQAKAITDVVLPVSAPISALKKPIGENADDVIDAARPHVSEELLDDIKSVNAQITTSLEAGSSDTESDDDAALNRFAYSYANEAGRQRRQEFDLPDVSTSEIQTQLQGLLDQGGE